MCECGIVVDRLQMRVGNAGLLAPVVLRGLTENLEAIDDSDEPKTWARRLANISTTALNDFIDIMAFLVLGACLAAGGKALLKTPQGMHIETIIQGSPALAILVMMAIAILICLCSEADAFVAYNFPATWAPASKIAFLVLGPMMDLKLFLMYTRVFRPRL